MEADRKPVAACIPVLNAYRSNKILRDIAADIIMRFVGIGSPQSCSSDDLLL